MEDVETFVAYAHTCVNKREHARLEAIVTRWVAAWQGSKRALDFTRSLHGTSLHFNQLIGTHWVQAFTLHANKRDGFFLKGPDTDRERKSHKLRANPLDRTSLDALFAAWSLRPEARPAGLAVTFHLEETPDDTWEACLQDALKALAG